VNNQDIFRANANTKTYDEEIEKEEINIDLEEIERREKINHKLAPKSNETGISYEEHQEKVDEIMEKQEIDLPTLGRLISEFTEETTEILKTKNTLFYKVDSREIVEIGKVTINEEQIYTGFISMKPSRFITLVEKYFIPVVTVWNKQDRCEETKSKSITKELATTMLHSSILDEALPQITRIFTVPIPIIHKGKLTFPKSGYDERFRSWMPSNAPKISNPEMSIKEAKEIFKQIFQEFCFEEQQDYYNAISALLTPFLKGLFTKFNKRAPVFFYLANRERAGKDYLAGITGLIYEGNSIEESPISSGEKGNNTEELRKKVMSALMTGRKRMHFSNNRGYIDNAIFEGIITSESHSDRVLGRNEILTFDNEIDFSLSGNTGVGFTADLANRCIMVRLLLNIENANERRFNNPDLYSWILDNREQILSALYALIRNWIEKGKPQGTLPFASFPEWSHICGGIMESAGYGNPCVLDKTIGDNSGDVETNHMKTLFEAGNDIHGETKIRKEAIIAIVEDLDLFPFLNLDNNRADQTKFGTLLNKFVRRTLSDITLMVDDVNKRGSRREYVFSKTKLEKSVLEF
jgi:hypothetical protein